MPKSTKPDKSKASKREARQKPALRTRRIPLLVEIDVDDIFLRDAQDAGARFAIDLDAPGAPPWELLPTLELMIIVGLGSLGIKPALTLKKGCLRIRQGGDRHGPYYFALTETQEALMDVAKEKLISRGSKPGPLF